MWCEGWSDSRNRGEWLLRVCSRLEEGAAKGEERRWVRMERTIRPLDRTPPGNLLNPSPPLERAGIKLRSFATHTKRKRIRISSRFRQSAAIRFAILTGRGRKTLEPPEVISRNIYNNHSARRTTNIQQRINRWSSAGFFFLPPLLPFLLTRLTDLSRFWKSCNEFDSRETRRRFGLFLHARMVFFAPLFGHARMIILTG